MAGLVQKNNSSKAKLILLYMFTFFRDILYNNIIGKWLPFLGSFSNHLYFTDIYNIYIIHTLLLAGTLARYTKMS